MIKKPKRSFKTMDVILIIIAVLLISFTISMIVIYLLTGSIPDTLCTCVFAALGGECGVMGWIKNSKERYKEREWEMQDRKQKDISKEDSE